jgi:hypothetical protein
LPFGSGVLDHRVPTGSPDPRQHPFGSGHQPVSGRLSGNHQRRSQHQPFPVSRCLSATGIRFSGRPAPAAEFSLPHGQPTRQQIFVWTSTGLSRSARDRCDRGGCPLYPGDGGALPPGQIPPGGTRRLTAAGPYLPLKLPICGSANDEASTRLHAIHPSGLSQPVAPGWNGNPWALHPGLRTPRSPTTHAEAGTVPAHWTGHYTIDISRPSFDEYRCTRATSCRTIQFSHDALLSLRPAFRSWQAIVDKRGGISAVRRRASTSRLRNAWAHVRVVFEQLASPTAETPRTRADMPPIRAGTAPRRASCP